MKNKVDARTVVVCFLALAFVWVASEIRTKFAEKNGNQQKTEANKFVSRQQMGDDWPIERFDSGFVLCKRVTVNVLGESKAMHALIFRSPDGKEYALNGPAIDAGYHEIDSICTVVEPGPNGWHKSIQPLANEAEKLCK